MKRLFVIAFGLLTLTVMQAQQNNIQQVLQQIEQNNKELKANAQLVTAQKLEAKTENNLDDPTLSYAHLWKANDKSQTVGEMIVSQSFDFPTLYAARNKHNLLKGKAWDSEVGLMRQSILLQAKELCMDIIMLRQQKEILDERFRNAQELAKMYDKRLQTGDANAIETNKIKLELLNVKTETAMNATTLKNKIQELNGLNGNVPVVFELSQYPEVALPIDYQQLKTEVMTTDRTVDLYNQQSIVARNQIQLNQSQWLPKLELGYRRNTESGAPFNGVVVGFSFPIFANRNKVKLAKAQALNSDLLKDNATLKLESEFAQLYQSAQTLYQSMEDYHQTFQSQQNLNLLKEALTGGQISMIEYFAEVAVIYQSRQNLLALENEYQKVMAKIYKNNL